MRVCRPCRAAYVFPLPSAEEQREIALREARARLPRERDAGVIRRIGEHNREILESLEARGCRGALLDVGCGRGLLMADARTRGWRVKGVELASPTAEEGIRERGLDISIGTLDTAPLTEASFDAVVFCHSLEHIPDPAGVLGTAARLLKRGGWAYVETPNWSALSRRLVGRHWWNIDPEGHLFCFSSASLSLLCARAGLKLRTAKSFHLDTAALLISVAHFHRDDYTSFDRINECRDRLMGVRGAWTFFSYCDLVMGSLLRGGVLNDYLALWMQKP